MTLFSAPLAASYFARTFFSGTVAGQWIERLSFVSPFAMAFRLPVDTMMPGSQPVSIDWLVAGMFLAFYLLVDGLLLASLGALFDRRWRTE
jgi:hypothetical protein